MLQLYNYINNSKQGASFPNINTGFLKNTIIPVPPIEEQKAIIEKIESLMEKCAILELEIQRSEEHANMLMQAVLKEAFETKEMV